MANTPSETAPVPITSDPTSGNDNIMAEKSYLINVFDDVNVADNTVDHTRKLEFQAQNLGQDIDLLLMFEPPEKSGTLYVDLFPLCWKIISFSATGIAAGNVLYTGKLGLFVPQIKSGNIVAASNAQPCEAGQKCSLKTNDKKNNYLTDAENDTPDFIKCLNSTGRPGDIGIGYFNEAGTKIEPVLLWKAIANKNYLSSQLTPKLKIYGVSDYKESEIIKGDIESPLLWERDLISLRPYTEWNVSIDVGTGEILIKEV